MNRQLAAGIGSFVLAALTAAWAHPATELYIPIGKSPGISHLKSRIGPIASLSATQSGLTMALESGSVYVAFDKNTKIYVQYADPGRANQLGTYADCRAGLTAEVYTADDGTVPWVKVLVP
jgi:hypothetical protein